MTKRIPFDPTTRYMERQFKDIWKPYAFEEHRAERDAVYGPTPDAGDEELFKEPDLFIPRTRFYDAYEAICFANYSGFVLSKMLTVNWEQCGFAQPVAIDTAYNAFMERFAKFISQKRQKLYYISVFENTLPTGYHSHILFHLPLYLKEAIEKWLMNSVVDPEGRPVCDNRIDLKTDKDSNFTAQWNRFQYMFKCIDPRLQKREVPIHHGKTTHQIYGLTRGVAGLGEVKFQRVRIARAMNRAAQREIRYTPWWDIRYNDYPVLERYSDYEYKRGAEDRMQAEVSRVFQSMESPL